MRKIKNIIQKLKNKKGKYGKNCNRNASKIEKEKRAQKKWLQKPFVLDIKKMSLEEVLKFVEIHNEKRKFHTSEPIAHI